jgi:hypothetical protein
VPGLSLTTGSEANTQETSGWTMKMRVRTQNCDPGYYLIRYEYEDEEILAGRDQGKKTATTGITVN